MSHTLIFESGMPPQSFLTSCKVNGVQVSSGYTLHDGDVIEAYYTPAFPVRPEHGVYIICNGNTYGPIPTYIEIALSDVDIVFSGNGVERVPFPLDFPKVTLVINYSESGSGSTLDVTYNDFKIIDSEEVTSPVAVTYNGSTIATLNDGDTRTLDILGSDNLPKILATPIIIGGKTIPDVDALGRKWALEHNLVVTVRGGVTPTSETWVINENVYTPIEIDTLVAFESAGNRYSYFEFNIQSPGEIMPYPYRRILMYDSFLIWYDGTWVSPSYRTIVLDEPATGDFLTWLQTNAVKQ